MDLSVGLSEETVDFSSAAGLGAQLRRVVSRCADGDIANMSELRMSAHAGTHLDAPSHFVQVRAQALSRSCLPAAAYQILRCAKKPCPYLCAWPFVKQTVQW